MRQGAIPLFVAVRALMSACPWYLVSEESLRADPDAGEHDQVAHLARYLIRCLDMEETTSFRTAFAIVERILVAGDVAARALINEVFLEELTALHNYEDFALRPDAFAPWLGPEARQHPKVTAWLGADPESPITP